MVLVTTDQKSCCGLPPACVEGSLTETPWCGVCTSTATAGALGVLVIGDGGATTLQRTALLPVACGRGLARPSPLGWHVVELMYAYNCMFCARGFLVGAFSVGRQ